MTKDKDETGDIESWRNVEGYVGVSRFRRQEVGSLGKELADGTALVPMSPSHCLGRHDSACYWLLLRDATADLLPRRAIWSRC